MDTVLALLHDCAATIHHRVRGAIATGATLAGIAEKHGKTRDQLKSFIVDHAMAEVNTAVSNSDLSQKQADDVISMLQQRIGQIIDQPLGMCDG